MMPLQKNPVGWFEIPVTDMSRAKAFYEYVFEVELEEHVLGPLQMAWFKMYGESYGATGTLVKGEHYVPSLSGVLVYFTTPDIGRTLSRAEERGGKILTARTGIGDYGFIGLLQDCEGNHIGLHSMV